MDDPQVLVMYSTVQLSITNISNILMISYCMMVSSSLIGQKFLHLVSHVKIHKAVHLKLEKDFKPYDYFLFPFQT